MNYEKLSKLAGLLDSQHGRPEQSGFIVAPHSELQFLEHKNALIHANRIFNYQPISDERLGIYSITRNEAVNEDSSVKADYAHTRLEHSDYEALANSETASLLSEYIEFTKSRV